MYIWIISIAFYAAGLAILAIGSPLGAVFMVMGAIAVSLKIGMPVRRPARQDRLRAPATIDGKR